MSIDLTTEQSLRIEPGTPIELTCHFGVVWITQERDVRDLFLGPGEATVLDSRGLALVTALEPARIGVRERSNLAAKARTVAARWLQRTSAYAGAIWHRRRPGAVTKIDPPLAN